MRFILRVLSGPYELSVAGMGGAFMDKLGTGLPMGLFICSRFVLPYIRLHIHDLLLKEYFVITNGTYPYLHMDEVLNLLVHCWPAAFVQCACL